ncbi:MAG: orotate phosphoribosyltransferase [Eubacteriales bacterium]|nr:orotate phosphoribosyltransferase [Clostridiales bacterium]MDD7307817.1 orotate phosphoribosyltransferase [Eubacteriales bacterium]MDY2932595.1 orotate phosphoribosyltransferase [Anaerovoracaceae bacterium]
MSREKIAELLLETEAVFLRPDEPFVWASGIKSPVYCDNRLTLTAPQARNIIEQAMADTVKAEYPEAEVLMGTSTAGIAHAAIAAHILGLPMGYVRGAAKDHGRGNRIEGRLLPGQKTVVIEDLISTGGSVLDTVEALRQEGAEVLGIVSIFTYQFEEAERRMSETGVKNISLCDLDALMQAAELKGYITAEQRKMVEAFRADPKDWR